MTRILALRRPCPSRYRERPGSIRVAVNDPDRSNRLRPVFEHRQSAPGKARSKPWGRGLSKEDHGLREAGALWADALAPHAKADSPWSLRPCWPCAPKTQSGLGRRLGQGLRGPVTGGLGGGLRGRLGRTENQLQVFDCLCFQLLFAIEEANDVIFSWSCGGGSEEPLRGSWTSHTHRNPSPGSEDEGARPGPGACLAGKALRNSHLG